MKPHIAYRPTRASDGEGGYNEVLGVGRTIWGRVKVDAKEVIMAVKAPEPVKIGDIVGVQEEVV